MPAPLASLFLVLSLCAFVVQRPASAGMHFPITRVRVVSFHDSFHEGYCYDDRDIFVRIKKDGSTWINETQEQPSEVAPLIAQIMEPRAYKPPVYVLTDPEVSYGRFASLFKQISASSSDLHVGVITPQLDRELRQCPLGSICGLDWLDHRPSYSCIEFNVPPVRILRSPVH
ncbi:MAG: ExbD/TolR family protein [Terracidiphilus sp.]